MVAPPKLVCPRPSRWPTSCTITPSQSDGSLARSEGGLGIGLTLVRSLVEMHGGRVEAHIPGLGQGSELVVRLPVRVPLTAEALMPSSETAPRLGLDTSLLVAMTGYGQPEDRRRSREAGIHHHFVKPVEPLVLRNLLADVAAPVGSGH